VGRVERPSVLFVGRTRYRLPLAAGLARKWEAIERELDYVVLASRADGSSGSHARFELVPAAPALDGPLFYVLLPLRARRAIRRIRPDVVVAETPYVAAAVLLARATLRGTRPRVIAEVHGNWRLATRLHGSPQRRYLGPIGDVIGDAAVRRVDAVRALSSYTASLAEQVRGAPVRALLPTFTDLEAFTARPVQPLPDRPTALFVGVLERYKNVDGLVAAWRLVQERLPHARLVVVGRGPLAELLAQIDVEHVIELDAEGIAARMDESWVLVLPSRFEGLGRVVIESFARGRGVVASRAGGILDLVTDGVEGLLVSPEDHADLADALTRVLADRTLAERLGTAARERYADWHSTPEQFAARLRELVESTLA
jgi:glycosyltransferase involved in cell wall biosynthesis